MGQSWDCTWQWNDLEDRPILMYIFLNMYYLINFYLISISEI